MRFSNIVSGNGPAFALVANDELTDLTAQLGVRPDDPWEFLAMGAQARALAEGCLRSTAARLAVASAKFLPSVLRPDKILGVGMNYHSLVAAVHRLGLPLSTELIWFSRPRGCIAGPYDDVWLPRNATDFDYEAELAVVIGRRCRHVSVADARAVIAGFTIANDLTLRQRVMRSAVLGKSFDTHTPLGPWLVTPDEIGDPHDLAISTWVNGQLRQQSSTADMIASCFELIAEISAVCTLNPGDILLTGTPDGSGILRQPPAALAAGDTVKIEIQRIGTIENRVIDEPPVA